MLQENTTISFWPMDLIWTQNLMADHIYCEQGIFYAFIFTIITLSIGTP